MFVYGETYLISRAYWWCLHLVFIYFFASNLITIGIFSWILFFSTSTFLNFPCPLNSINHQLIWQGATNFQIHSPSLLFWLVYINFKLSRWLNKNILEGHHFNLLTLIFIGLREIEGVGLVKPKLFGFHFYFPSSFVFFLGDISSDVFLLINYGYFPNASPCPLLAGLNAD